MKRGHSNIDSNYKKIKPWDQIDPTVDPGIACIPISGGSTPSSCKELPPLALIRQEWEEIGRRMGWLTT